MTENERSVLTDRVLEHSIFSNRPIYISPQNDSGRKGSFYIQEILKDCFIAKPSPENVSKIELDDLKDKDLQVMIGYRSQAFAFSTQLVNDFKEILEDPKGKKSYFIFKKPYTGMLKNQRLRPRFSLKEYAPYLRAEIRVSNNLGDFSFETRHLVDLSHTTIALFLDRTQGLVLPGDRVTNISIYHQNEIVLESEGTILRTNMDRMSDQLKNSYFIVISLKQSLGLGDWPLTDRSGVWGSIPMERTKAYVEADHSILRGYGFSGEIHNLSTSSLSFFVENPEVPFIPGLVLNELYVNIPPNNFKLKACVKINQCKEILDDDKHRYNVSGEFHGMSIDLIKAVNRLKENLIDARLVEAKREDYDQLLEFFFESGFIYSAKRKQIQEYAASVRRTNLILLQSDGPVVKKVLFKEKRQIKGHISALRYFDRTWLVQHMTTHHATGTTTSSAILASIINFFLDPSANRKVDTSFVVCFFRPDNLYPEILFGETQRMIGNPDICGMIDTDFCVLEAPVETLKPKKKAGIQCAEAQAEDLVRLERMLVDQGRYHLIRIEGLTAEGLTHLGVSAEYEKMGLYRKRRVFLARRSTGATVYAVCNYTSPGCNLSELTNSFQIYYDQKSAPDMDLINSLTSHVLVSYKATEMKSPVLLLNPGQAMPEYFKKKRVYRYWFLDAAYFDLFKRIAESNIVNMRDILKRLKSNNASKKDLSYGTH